MQIFSRHRVNKPIDINAKDPLDILRERLEGALPPVDDDNLQVSLRQPYEGARRGTLIISPDLSNSELKARDTAEIAVEMARVTDVSGNSNWILSVGGRVLPTHFVEGTAKNPLAVILKRARNSDSANMRYTSNLDIATSVISAGVKQYYKGGPDAVPINEYISKQFSAMPALMEYAHLDTVPEERMSFWSQTIAYIQPAALGAKKIGDNISNFMQSRGYADMSGSKGMSMTGESDAMGDKVVRLLTSARGLARNVVDWHARGDDEFSAMTFAKRNSAGVLEAQPPKVLSESKRTLRSQMLLGDRPVFVGGADGHIRAIMNWQEMGDTTEGLESQATAFRSGEQIITTGIMAGSQMGLGAGRAVGGRIIKEQGLTPWHWKGQGIDPTADLSKLSFDKKIAGVVLRNTTLEQSQADTVHTKRFSTRGGKLATVIDRVTGQEQRLTENETGYQGTEIRRMYLSVGRSDSHVKQIHDLVSDKYSLETVRQAMGSVDTANDFALKNRREIEEYASSKLGGLLVRFGADDAWIGGSSHGTQLRYEVRRLMSGGSWKNPVAKVSANYDKDRTAWAIQQGLDIAMSTGDIKTPALMDMFLRGTMIGEGGNLAVEGAASMAPEDLSRIQKRHNEIMNNPIRLAQQTAIRSYVASLPAGSEDAHVAQAMLDKMTQNVSVHREIVRNAGTTIGAAQLRVLKAMTMVGMQAGKTDWGYQMSLASPGFLPNFYGAPAMTMDQLESMKRLKTNADGTREFASPALAKLASQFEKTGAVNNPYLALGLSAQNQISKVQELAIPEGGYSIHDTADPDQIIRSIMAQQPASQRHRMTRLGDMAIPSGETIIQASTNEMKKAWIDIFRPYADITGDVNVTAAQQRMNAANIYKQHEGTFLESEDARTEMQRVYPASVFGSITINPKSLEPGHEFDVAIGQEGMQQLAKSLDMPLGRIENFFKKNKGSDGRSNVFGIFTRYPQTADPVAGRIEYGGKNFQGVGIHPALLIAMYGDLDADPIGLWAAIGRMAKGKLGRFEGDQQVYDEQVASGLTPEKLGLQALLNAGGAEDYQSYRNLVTSQFAMFNKRADPLSLVDMDKVRASETFSGMNDDQIRAAMRDPSIMSQYFNQGVLNQYDKDNEVAIDRGMLYGLYKKGSGVWGKERYTKEDILFAPYNPTLAGNVQNPIGEAISEGTSTLEDLVNRASVWTGSPDLIVQKSMDDKKAKEEMGVYNMLRQYRDSFSKTTGETARKAFGGNGVLSRIAGAVGDYLGNPRWLYQIPLDLAKMPSAFRRLYDKFNYGFLEEFASQYQDNYKSTLAKVTRDVFHDIANVKLDEKQGKRYAMDSMQLASGFVGTKDPEELKRAEAELRTILDAERSGKAVPKDLGGSDAWAQRWITGERVGQSAWGHTIGARVGMQAINATTPGGRLKLLKDDVLGDVWGSETTFVGKPIKDSIIQSIRKHTRENYANEEGVLFAQSMQKRESQPLGNFMRAITNRIFPMALGSLLQKLSGSKESVLGPANMVPITGIPGDPRGALADPGEGPRMVTPGDFVYRNDQQVARLDPKSRAYANASSLYAIVQSARTGNIRENDPFLGSIQPIIRHLFGETKAAAILGAIDQSSSASKMGNYLEDTLVAANKAGQTESAATGGKAFGLGTHFFREEANPAYVDFDVEGSPFRSRYLPDFGRVHDDTLQSISIKNLSIASVDEEYVKNIFEGHPEYAVQEGVYSFLLGQGTEKDDHIKRMKPAGMSDDEFAKIVKGGKRSLMKIVGNYTPDEKDKVDEVGRKIQALVKSGKRVTAEDINKIDPGRLAAHEFSPEDMAKLEAEVPGFFKAYQPAVMKIGGRILNIAHALLARASGDVSDTGAGIISALGDSQGVKNFSADPAKLRQAIGTLEQGMGEMNQMSGVQLASGAYSGPELSKPVARALANFLGISQSGGLESDLFSQRMAEAREGVIAPGDTRHKAALAATLAETGKQSPKVQQGLIAALAMGGIGVAAASGGGWNFSATKIPQTGTPTGATTAAAAATTAGAGQPVATGDFTKLIEKMDQFIDSASLVIMGGGSGGRRGGGGGGARPGGFITKGDAKKIVSIFGATFQPSGDGSRILDDPAAWRESQEIGTGGATDLGGIESTGARSALKSLLGNDFRALPFAKRRDMLDRANMMVTNPDVQEAARGDPGREGALKGARRFVHEEIEALKADIAKSKQDDTTSNAYKLTKNSAEKLGAAFDELAKVVMDKSIPAESARAQAKDALEKVTGHLRAGREILATGPSKHGAPVQTQALKEERARVLSELADLEASPEMKAMFPNEEERRRVFSNARSAATGRGDGDRSVLGDVGNKLLSGLFMFESLRAIRYTMQPQMQAGQASALGRVEDFMSGNQMGILQSSVEGLGNLPQIMTGAQRQAANVMRAQQPLWTGATSVGTGISRGLDRISGLQGTWGALSSILGPAVGGGLIGAAATAGPIAGGISGAIGGGGVVSAGAVTLGAAGIVAGALGGIATASYLHGLIEDDAALVRGYAGSTDIQDRLAIAANLSWAGSTGNPDRQASMDRMARLQAAGYEAAVQTQINKYDISGLSPLAKQAMIDVAYVNDPRRSDATREIGKFIYAQDVSPSTRRLMEATLLSATSKYGEFPEVVKEQIDLAGQLALSRGVSSYDEITNALVTESGGHGIAIDPGMARAKIFENKLFGVDESFQQLKAGGASDLVAKTLSQSKVRGQETAARISSLSAYQSQYRGLTGVAPPNDLSAYLNASQMTQIGIGPSAYASAYQAAYGPASGPTIARSFGAFAAQYAQQPGLGADAFRNIELIGQLGGPQGTAMRSAVFGSFVPPLMQNAVALQEFQRFNPGTISRFASQAGRGFLGPSFAHNFLTDTFNNRGLFDVSLFGANDMGMPGTPTQSYQDWRGLTYTQPQASIASDYAMQQFGLSRPAADAAAGKTYSGVGGITGLQWYARDKRLEFSLRSIGISGGELAARREFELYEQSQKQYSLERQRASLYGGTAAGPWGSVTYGQTPFDKLPDVFKSALGNKDYEKQYEKFGWESGGGQFAWQRQMFALSVADTVAGFNQQQTRMNWNLEDVNRNQFQFRRQTEWQRQDFGDQRAQVQAQRAFQTYEFGYSLQGLQRSRQYAIEDYGYNQQMRNMQHGWQVSDLNEAIRRSTGYERRQLSRRLEREETTFGMESGQMEKQNQRQMEQFKREEEHMKKQREHVLYMQKFEDKEFDKTKERFEEQTKWREEEFEIQKNRIEVEKGWSAESFARQMAQHAIRLDQLNAEQQATETDLKMAEDKFKKEKELSEELFKLSQARLGLAKEEAVEIGKVQKAIDELQESGKSSLSGLTGFFDDVSYGLAKSLVDYLNPIITGLGGTALPSPNAPQKVNATTPAQQASLEFHKPKDPPGTGGKPWAGTSSNDDLRSRVDDRASTLTIVVQSQLDGQEIARAVAKSIDLYKPKVDSTRYGGRR